MPQEGPKTEVVETSRLDDMISQGKIPIPDLLKIDAEGFDYEVLLSLGEHIRALRALIFELPAGQPALDSLEKISTLATDHGLTLSSIWPATSSQDGYPKMDALFLRKT